MKHIPSAESVSAELAALVARRDALNARLLEIAAEQRALHASLASAQELPAHEYRVSALVAGAAFEPKPEHRDKLASLSAEKRDIDEALHRLAATIVEERRRASRIIVDQFAGDYRALAREYFLALAATAAVHVRIGQLRRDFERAGIEPTGLRDVGRDLLGAPLDKSSNVAIDLRRAVRDGHLKTSEIPGVIQ